MLAVHAANAALSGTSEVSFKSNLGYSGEQWDASLRMQNLRARAYAPGSGRFIGLDPFAGNMQDPQSSHKYVYVHGDPIGMIDPSGKSAIHAVFLALDFISVHLEAVNAGYQAHNAGSDGLEGYKFGLKLSILTTAAMGVLMSAVAPWAGVMVRNIRVNTGFWGKLFRNLDEFRGRAFTVGGKTGSSRAAHMTGGLNPGDIHIPAGIDVNALANQVRDRMQSLGIPPNEIADQPFSTLWDGGGSAIGGRIEVDAGVFRDDLFDLLGSDASKAWRQMDVSERIDAVIIHESIENRIILKDERFSIPSLYGDDWQSSHLQTLIEQVQRSHELPVSPNVKEFLHKQLQDTFGLIGR